MSSRVTRIPQSVSLCEGRALGARISPLLAQIIARSYLFRPARRDGNRQQQQPTCSRLPEIDNNSRSHAAGRDFLFLRRRHHDSRIEDPKAEEPNRDSLEEYLGRGSLACSGKDCLVRSRQVLTRETCSRFTRKNCPAPDSVSAIRSWHQSPQGDTSLSGGRC